MKLYEIGQELFILSQMMEEDWADDEVLKDTLEAVTGEAEVKLENIAKIIKNIDADVKALKAEEDRLKARRNTLTKNMEWLKGYALGFMQNAGMDKVKGQVLTISVANNGGKLPVILDKPVEELPDEFCKIKREADSTKLAELIDAGACEYAHYGERGQHLNIR